ncbi:hypothetical protein VOLCADRAFT_96769 [Volvox carteri f. nagariensis]|uniref:Flavin reductase like domain-containing protein n=1 Tax=Volvox carteri f. nagariensis TaxID=3068 RepID=D8UB02_VOLCA|nr:uncharacterized protein VOLCADRAFT_96769 [Volvox carteri f. nagariensis]EFJ43026.1 hypothetical protein VOLCADRAFT_96769 [Volvox carteri f. nagariensis]|eukprot:XP_002955825.1 hypothetical protein VOLCADRAFT_96769 [Volvox carteri f. nagariensis]
MNQATLRAATCGQQVYDTRRGQCEGEEADKLLSFFPTIAPIHVRTSIVGLAQAVSSFAATLNQPPNHYIPEQNGSRFKTMVAEHNKWVMFECEPSIWVLAVVRKSWAGGTCTNAAFKALLTSMYDVFVLLHGSMDTLLEQDPTGFALRRVLQPLLDEIGFRLLRPEAAASREPGGHVGLLANPLAPHCPGTVPLITTSHHTFLAVQSLVNQLLVASFYGSRLVAGVMVMWGGGGAVWSTLSAQDTAALSTLATRALVPAAKAAQKSRPGGAGASVTAIASNGSSGGGGGAAAAAGPGETAYETLLSPLQWRAGGGITSAPPPPPAAPSSSAAAAALSPAVSSLAAMAAGLGLTSTAAAAAGGGGSGSAIGGGGGAMFGPSTPAGISLAGILGFGVGAGAVPATVAAPALPVSSSATAGPPSSASSASAPGAGGGSTGSALPPFLSSFLRPRLRPSLYSSAPGGALPLDTPLPMTQVWLRLLPYHRGQLLVLALLHDGPPPGTEVLAALAAVLGRGAGPAAAALAAEIPARSVWHEKGHRYCFTDSLCHVTRYSPLKKVLTLSTAAAAAASSVADRTTGAGDSELVVRTGYDAWLVLRSAPGGRRLYAASEQGHLADLALTQGVEPSLAAAVAPTDALNRFNSVVCHLHLPTTTNAPERANSMASLFGAFALGVAAALGLREDASQPEPYALLIFPVGFNPPTVAIGLCHSASKPEGKKDTLRNIEQTREFVVNVISEWFVEAANHTCGDYPPGVDEMRLAGLHPMPSTKVRPPRVAESAVHLECRVRDIHIVRDSSGTVTTSIVIGQVVAFHVAAAVAGRSPSGKLVVDLARLAPVARCGGVTYARCTELYDMARPDKHGQYPKPPSAAAPVAAASTASPAPVAKTTKMQ